MPSLEELTKPGRAAILTMEMQRGVIGDLETCHAFWSMIAKAAACPVLSVDFNN